MIQHAAKAFQGHRYSLGDQSVIAMQNGIVVTVRPIVDEAWPLGPTITVKASWLVPEPMRYFYGDTT